MRMHFSASGIPTRAAKRLKVLLGIKESLARSVTARVFGYRDWHELEASIGAGAPSPLDEECSQAQLAARTAFQTQKLIECELGNLVPAPREVISRWRPSAAKPQAESVSRASAAGAPQRDAEFRALSLVKELHLLVDDPPRLAREVDASAPELLRLIQLVDRPLVFRALDVIARTLMQLDEGSQHTGRLIWEALAARGHAQAMVNLATALRIGHGGPPDPKRAGDLLERVIASADTEQWLAIHARNSLADIWATGAGGRGVRVDRALELWEQSAALGDATAAFNVGLLVGGMAGSQADLPKAAKFYRIAAKAGHVHAMTNLGLLLLHTPGLAQEVAEADVYLQKAAAAGDRNAALALRELDRMADRVLDDLDAGRLPPEQIARVQADIVSLARGANPFPKPTSPPPAPRRRRGR